MTVPQKVTVRNSVVMTKENDLIMLYRPVSEMIRIFVLPEIELRTKAGTLREESLPVEIFQFRVYQINENGNWRSVVELNEEVNLLCKVKVKEDRVAPGMIGKILRLDEIDTGECFIERPKHNGKECGYAYLDRIFLSPRLTFDFTPNVPASFKGSFSESTIKYPIEQIIKESNFLKNIKPYEKIELLTKYGWPPSPSYYPQIFLEMHSNQQPITPDFLLGVIEKSFNEEYWEQKFKFWNGAHFFSKRIKYIEKAIERFFEGDFISAIYIICPQFEGIIKDYLEENKAQVGSYRDNIETLKSILFSRKVLMFPKRILEIILGDLKDGTFTQRTSKIKEPARETNRHGILHGIFTDFENKELALKLLILIDSLAFVLLSDKMASGTI